MDKIVNVFFSQPMNGLTDGCCAEHNIAINYFNFHLHKVSSHIKELHFGRNK